jgi:hypothetical protein
MMYDTDDTNTVSDPMSLLTAFDRRIDQIPFSWRGPIVDVVDTADTIHLKLEELGIDSPELLLGLTRLAMERYDAQKDD